MTIDLRHFLLTPKYRNHVKASIHVYANEEDQSSKGRPGGKMIEFIKQEGDKRVRNPDTGNDVKIKSLGNGPKSKKLKGELFQKWLESQEESKPAPKKTSPAKSKPSKKNYSFGLTSDTMDKIKKTYAATLKKVVSDLKKADPKKALQDYTDVAKTKYATKPDSKVQKLLEGLDSKELQFHAVSETIGKNFMEAWKESNPKASKAFNDYFSGKNNDSWLSDSDSPKSFEIRGTMEGMGIPSGVDQDQLTSREKKEFGWGKDDAQPELKEAIQEAYAFTQAVFEELGITELTCYRGVQEQTDGMDVGTEVDLQTRGLSSWSINPQVATEFGSVLEAKIPVERIFGGFTNSEQFGGSTHESRFGEAELMVLGGEPVTSKVALK